MSKLVTKIPRMDPAEVIGTLAQVLVVLWWIGFPGYLILSAAWEHFHPRPKPTKEQLQAQRAAEEAAAYQAAVAGEWVSPGGHVTMSLNLEGHRVKIVETKDKKPNIQSGGKWRIENRVVIVEAVGAAGSYNLKLEPAGGGVVDILSPAPISSALVKDSYFRIPEPKPDEPDYDAY